MDIETDLVDSIKACRTCGIHYVAPSKHQLKHLFQSSQELSEVMLIRFELSNWNIEVAENDGFPQYVCNTCIHKFEQMFQLRASCINVQNEFRKFYGVPNGNVPNIKIKTELPDSNADVQPSICDFIYVDELSDAEYDGATPFNFPHIPIKEEIIEAATVPMEESDQPINVDESASRIGMQSPSSLQTNNFVLQSVREVISEPAAVKAISEEVQCNLCHCFCSNQEEHKKHMQSIHDIGDLKCRICGKEFKNSTSARLKLHMKWHSLNKQFKCNLCVFMSNTKEALIVHKRAGHRMISCRVCGKGVFAKKMKSHMRQHELVKKYPCEYCTKGFATEEERENHIWQIHANEDNTACNSTAKIQTTYMQTANDNFLNTPQEDTLPQAPQEDILYKFICAHCEHRFMEQIDLETHVNEEHRGRLAIFETESVKAARIIGNCKDSQNMQNFNESEVFEEYGKDNEIHVTHMSNDNPEFLTKDLILPASSSFVSQTEQEPTDHTVLGSSLPSDEESETEASSSLSTHVDNLNRFACAKCSETFVSIEQLRQHHEQHLAVENKEQETKTTPTKSNFQCNVCLKWFGLKFKLNRHIKKHQNHAPF